MLTVLLGQDVNKRLEKQNELISRFQNKNYEIIEMTDASFDFLLLKEIAGSAGLFGGQKACLIKGLEEDKEKLEEFFEDIKVISDSNTEFVLSVSKLTAPYVKKIEKAEARIVETGDTKKEKTYEAFNVFNLTDAFSARNRSQTWALYRSAIDAGLDPRELAGKFFWATKTMIVSKNSGNAKESGLHEFVYKKAKSNAGNFKDGELEKISYELTKVFHDSMIESYDLEVALEALVLRMLAKQ